MRSNFNHCDVKPQQKPVRRVGSGKNEEGRKGGGEKGFCGKQAWTGTRIWKEDQDFFLSLKFAPLLAHLAATITERRKNYKKGKNDSNYVLAVFSDLGLVRKGGMNSNER
jgi:hypothetical protein